MYLIYKKSLEKYGLLVQMKNLEHLGLVDTRKSDHVGPCRRVTVDLTSRQSRHISLGGLGFRV